jgi:hypothetical protein
MSNTNTGGPAFPHTDSMDTATRPGMTLREYAAIQLKVPDSGTDWLDDMIRKSQRNDLAAKAMQTLLLDDSYDFSDRDLIARKAYAYADAMITAREAA